MSSTMGEIKSVKVDNWGVFFLQKLQNFFNKTDYCDLTLQFHDNSQLKVHRLVLSACTDYFNVLEQTCEVVDDALIMPNELQADVVVPIVNFMYTGTLEFELKMYGKLLRTAKEMNMTVLLKLLEAHRRTMEGVNRSQRPPSPKAIRRRGVTGTSTSPQFQGQPQRRILTASNASPQRRIIQTKSTAPNSTQFRQQIGSTSLLRTTSSSQQKECNSSSISKTQQQSTSPFEQLRKGYNNTKRPASVTFETPPAKKPNIEDVKEFAEQQRMRKQIAAEYGDDQEYEGMLDDDIHNDDDDEDTTLPTSSSATTTRSQAQQQTPSATITFKHDNEKPTIVVKDTSNTKMNHAKIISEVLRQYPHLVKSNKNIKLKIMPSAGGQAHKIVVKKDQTDNATTASDINNGQQQTQQKVLTIEKAPQVVANKKPIQKDMASTDTSAISAIETTSTQVVQKRRIDSKTMHALIALGAENTTGPWLCLRCGVNGRPISIPSYRSFRRHLINTHKQVIDSALCEYCGWRSKTHRELHYHMQVEHKAKSSLYTFPECLMCANIFLDNSVLNQHMIDSHPDENQQQCIYCNKIFAKEGQLYVHIKTYHKKQALEDGIIEYSDEEYLDDNHKLEALKESKVKILSDISLPSTVPAKLDGEAEQASTSGADENTPTFINAEGEIITEPKFINADGNEVILTEEQRKEIMSQLNREHEGGVVMLLNENVFPVETANDLPTTQNVSAEVIGRIDEMDETENDIGQPGATNDDDVDDSQIYSELASENAKAAEKIDKSKKTMNENLEENKESAENLEWAENLISSQESAEESSKSKPTETETKNQDDISKKLKELTGDWSDDDENENEEDQPTADDDLDESFDPEFLVEKRPRHQKKSTTKVEKENTETEESENNKSEVTTIATVEPQSPKHEITEEPNIDEDDIELAMKSLHKDDLSDSEQKGDDSHVAEDNTETIATNAKTSATIDSINENDHSDENNLKEGETDNTVSANANNTVDESKESLQSELKAKDDEEEEENDDDDEDEDENIGIEAAASDDVSHSLGDDVEKSRIPETNTEDIDDADEGEAETEAQTQIEDDVEAELKSMEADDLTEKDSQPESKADDMATEESEPTTKESEMTEGKVKSLLSEWGDEDDEGDEDL